MDAAVSLLLSLALYAGFGSAIPGNFPAKTGANYPTVLEVCNVAFKLTVRCVHNRANAETVPYSK